MLIITKNGHSVTITRYTPPTSSLDRIKAWVLRRKIIATVTLFHGTMTVDQLYGANMRSLCARLRRGGYIR